MLYLFNITVLDNNNELKIININKKKKKIKQYVDLHRWSNINLDDNLKYIAYKSLRQRPTIVNKDLFKEDVNKLKSELISKFKKIILKKNDITIFLKTKIINSFKKFKNELDELFNEYLRKIKYKTIRNLNINYIQIENKKNYKTKCEKIESLESDKKS